LKELKAVKEGGGGGRGGGEEIECEGGWGAFAEGGSMRHQT